MTIYKDSRYEQCYILRVIDEGNLQYTSNRYKKKVTLRSDDIVYIIEPNDTLDKLSFEYYGDEKFWWVIADYNNISFFFDLEKMIGKEIRFPSYETLQMNILEEI